MLLSDGVSSMHETWAPDGTPQAGISISLGFCLQRFPPEAQETPGSGVWVEQTTGKRKPESEGSASSRQCVGSCNDLEGCSRELPKGPQTCLQERRASCGHLLGPRRIQTSYGSTCENFPVLPIFLSSQHRKLREEGHLCR